MMLEDVLRKGFAVAHQRIGIIFLDLLWKAIWLIGTLAALFLIGAWLGSAVQAIGWEDTGASAVNGSIAAAVLKELWNAYKAETVWMLTAVLLLSAFGWLFLEAFFRARFVGQRNTKLFFASGATKAAILGTTFVFLVLISIAGATTVAAVIFIAVAFFLTLLETLIRSDAVELLGTDLIRVTGLLGILLLFETMITASFVVIVLAGFLNVTRLADGLVMIGTAALVVLFLNLLHSYLLLVRFSAIGIMRENVVEV